MTTLCLPKFVGSHERVGIPTTSLLKLCNFCFCNIYINGALIVGFTALEDSPLFVQVLKKMFSRAVCIIGFCSVFTTVVQGEVSINFNVWRTKYIHQKNSRRALRENVRFRQQRPKRLKKLSTSAKMT